MKLNFTFYQKLLSLSMLVIFLSVTVNTITAQKVYEFKVGFNTANLDDFANPVEQNKWQRTDDNSLTAPSQADFVNPQNLFIIDHQANMQLITVTCNNGQMLAGLTLKALNKAIQFNSTNGVNFSSLLLAGSNNNPINIDIDGGVSTINNLEMQNFTYLYIKNGATINVNQLATLTGNLTFISGKMVMRNNSQFRFGYGKLQFLHPSCNITGEGNASFTSLDIGGNDTKEIFFTNPTGMENGPGNHFQFLNANNISLPDSSLGGSYNFLGGYGNGVTGSLMPATVTLLSTSFNNQNQTLTLTNNIAAVRLSLYGALILGNRDFILVDKDINNMFSFGSGLAFDYKGRMIVTNGTGRMIIDDFTGEAVFPLAHSTNAGLFYSPLKIENTNGPAESFAVRVADNVQFVYDQQQYKTVTATWFIEEETPGGNTATLSFQWDENEMEPEFVLNAAKAAHYDANNDIVNLIDGTPQNPDDVCRSFVAQGISNFSPWSIFSPFTPLPIKLISFDASLMGNNAILKWITATETDNDRFEIERSVDGINYLKIGEIKAKGNSIIQTDYNYSDNIKGLIGTIYYRLKQIDVDAAFSYSPVRVIKISNNKSAVTVWPNPFMDYLKLNINCNEAGVLTVRINSSEGRLLMNNKYEAKKGANEFTLNSLGNLAKGVYTIEIINANGLKEIHKIVK